MINQKRAFKVLCLTKSALDSLSINYWLTDGTLLGFIREGNFIPHDNDMDLGVHINQHSTQIIKAFADLDLKHFKTYGTIERGLVYSFKHGEEKLDIFFFYDDGEFMWHAAWPYKNKIANLKIIKWLGLSKPRMIKFLYPKFSTKIMVFQGVEFNVPSDPIQYLVLKYGETWKIPIKKWDWAKSPKNLSEE